MTPLFCVDITENRNNDRINGCDTELLEQRREDFREQFLWQLSLIHILAAPRPKHTTRNSRFRLPITALAASISTELSV